MPEEMRILLQEYPRDDWEGHPGFRDLTRQWLRARQSFRRLAASLRFDAEAFLDRSIDPSSYVFNLNRRGGILVGNLHGHHAWEDYEYFPELSSADQRFDRGLEILEKDHETLNVVFDAFTDLGTRVLQLDHSNEGMLRDEIGNLHPLIETIEAFLERHLGDEEDLAVPIILHHRLRG